MGRVSASSSPTPPLKALDISAIPEPLRKHVRPQRSITGSSFPADPIKVEQWVVKTYPKKPHSHADHSHQQVFKAGLAGKKDKTLAKARSEAHELLSNFAIAKLEAASLDALAIAEQIVWHMDWEKSLLSPIATARGLADAIRVLVRAARLTTASDRGYTTDIYIVPSKEGAQYRSEPSPTLRHLVCAASKKDYDEARRCAEELRKKGDDDDRILLAYVFPDEPWGTEELAKSIKQTTPAVIAAGNADDESWPLLSATSDAAVVKQWIDLHGAFHLAFAAMNLACRLPAKEAVSLFEHAIATLLDRPKYGPLHKTPPRNVAEGLTFINTRSAALVLAAYANNAIVGPLVLAYFRDHPEHGAVLAQHAKGKGKLEATTSRLLGKHEAIAKSSRAPIANASELPKILRDTPWRASSSSAKKGANKGEQPVLVIKGLSLLGLDREKVKLVREAEVFTDDTLRDMTKAELAAWKKKVEKDEYSHCDYEHMSGRGGGGGGGAGRSYFYLRVPDREGLWAWNASEQTYVTGSELAWVKKHGVAAIPGFLRRDWITWLDGYDESREIFDAARSLISPRMASQMARVAARRKRYRRIATSWLIENAEVAAYGLIFDMLAEEAKDASKDKKDNKKKNARSKENDPARAQREKRADAEAALLLISRHSLEHEAIVRKVAKRYGKDVENAIAGVLDRDPLAIDVAVPKRLMTFLRIADLPQVKLKASKTKQTKNTQKALSDDALRALVEMLQIASIDDPYPGLALVREACDHESLGELSVELLEQWVIADAPGRHDWMLASVIHFPSERGTRRVAELARETARKNQAKALRFCTALAADGSDLALMHLAHIAETTRFAALKRDAAALVQEAAGARGLTPDELGDRTVPDAGLGPDGTITLSYGSRDFVVGLDASLHPIVRERTKVGVPLGAPSNTLPRPSKADDAAKAKEARVRFDQLKKDLEAIAQRQVRRLERAMVLGRSWSVTDFDVRIAKHPLLCHLARALVWELIPPKGEARTFRMAEDGSCADARDKALVLPSGKGDGAKDGGARIRIAHPARTSDLAKTWSTLFGEYEIVQPFEQLGRAVFEPTAAEKKAKDLARAAGHVVPARKLLGTMESRGWQRNDAGHVSSWLRAVVSRDQERLDVRWPIRPGISMEDLRHAPDVTTEALVATDMEGKPATLGMIDPVGFSEIVRDIEAVRNL